MPVFNLVIDDDHFYGFPAHGIPGVKLGRYERQGESGDPDAISREPTLDDEPPLRAFAERYLPEGAGPTVALKTCLFELSPGRALPPRPAPRAEHVVVAARASPGTGSSSARSSARSSPTSRSTARRGTTSASFASTAS